MNQEQVSETLEIQRLVGKISNLEGNPAEQKNFFTRDVQLRIYMGEEMVLEIRGIANFEKGLKPFTTMIKRVHYINGQHVIDFLTKDKATGLLFCHAIHVTEEDGQSFITKHYIYNEDIYEKNRNGIWLVKARDAHYHISDKHVLGM